MVEPGTDLGEYWEFPKSGKAVSPKKYHKNLAKVVDQLLRSIPVPSHQGQVP